MLINPCMIYSYVFKFSFFFSIHFAKVVIELFFLNNSEYFIRIDNWRKITNRNGPKHYARNLKDKIETKIFIQIKFLEKLKLISVNSPWFKRNWKLNWKHFELRGKKKNIRLRVISYKPNNCDGLLCIVE